MEQEFFENSEEFLGENLLRNIFHIVRHIAHFGTSPKWFNFEQRQDHDLDTLAQKFINADFGPQFLNQQLKAEYEKKERYWNVIYHNYICFKEQYDDCANRILNPLELRPIIVEPSPLPLELPVQTKQQIKTRDNYRCLCCGENNSRLLQVDHTKPRYYGGNDSLGNLQTLCGTCNQIKGTKEIDFHKHQASLTTPLSNFPNLELSRLTLTEAGDKAQWEKVLCRSINFFYNCAAVESIKIGKEWEYWDHWEVCLHPSNNPGWLIPHLKKSVGEIRQVREKNGLTGPKKIIITHLVLMQLIQLQDNF
jgi:hypothetical protein